MDGYGPATYGDGFADVYDAWYSEVSDPEAVADVVAELAAGGRVLELGIGSGRLALPIAARGVEVWGIDASAAMVERLRAKPGGDSIPVALGDMTDVDLASLPGGDAGSFAVVLIAFNTLFNLTTAAAQAQCLARAAAVLAPDGQLVVEAVVPEAEPPAGGVEARAVELDKVVLNVSRRESHGGAVRGQVIEIGASGIRLRPWLVRPVGPEDIDAMTAAAGLRLVERWSGWERAAFVEHDPVHVSVYRPE
ncbi:MAG: class I SAM-dependent methyltransferase [Acidimicrobiales bacterium]